MIKKVHSMGEYSTKAYRSNSLSVRTVNGVLVKKISKDTIGSYLIENNYLKNKKELIYIAYKEITNDTIAEHYFFKNNKFYFAYPDVNIRKKTEVGNVVRVRVVLPPKSKEVSPKNEPYINRAEKLKNQFFSSMDW
ncbi:MAG: hypothetical protein AAF688_05380 [Bacteroidota bacterium]